MTGTPSARPTAITATTTATRNGYNGYYAPRRPKIRLRSQPRDESRYYSRSAARTPVHRSGGWFGSQGGVWTLLLIVGRHAANLTATVFLARLLTPTDYGLAGMVFAVTAFFQVLSDMGLSWATIRTHELTRRQVDNLFWLNVVTGAFFGRHAPPAAPS